MHVITIVALASPSRFTGYEQTRVMDLITVLAFASLIIWAIILVVMVIRQLVIIAMAIVAKRRIHQQTAQHKLRLSNGS